MRRSGLSAMRCGTVRENSFRRFVITNRGKYLNQWSYYQDGFEVYRENDLDGDRTLDECRWLNGGGTRVAVIKSGKIAGWKRLSAEEASKVLAQAFVGSDLGLLESLMATPEELAAAGVPRMWSTRSPPGRASVPRRSRPFRSHSPAGPPRPSGTGLMAPIPM